MLELLVVLAVVGILVVAGTPSVRGFLMNQELRHSAARLQSDFEFARHASVNRGGRVSVCPKAGEGCLGAPDWERGWIIFADTNGDRERQASEEVLRDAPLLRGITARASAGRRAVSFFPNGTAPGSNLTVWFCDERGPLYGRQVRVSLAGRIRGSGPGDGGTTGC